MQIYTFQKQLISKDLNKCVNKLPQQDKIVGLILSRFALFLVGIYVFIIVDIPNKVIIIIIINSSPQLVQVVKTLNSVQLFHNVLYLAYRTVRTKSPGLL